jgi:hypothetical protein
MTQPKSESVTTLLHAAAEVPEYPRVLYSGGEPFESHPGHQWSRYFRTIRVG